MKNEGANPMRKYTLPELGYPYDALEPHISETMLRLHHQKHHAGYVQKSNACISKLAAQRAGERDDDSIETLEKKLAFNLSGHVLHSLFWRNLAPTGGGEPAGTLREQIETDFGELGAFRAQMTSVAQTIMGSGWAALTWEPLAGRLLLNQIYDHQSNLSQASLPIMVLDAWEHAYYLQYRNEKDDYFEAIWNVWNWQDIAERFERAKSLDLGLDRAAT
jgi:Fe-Mn family superoxide dismutase